jgi:hypothetical protein
MLELTMTYGLACLEHLGYLKLISGKLVQDKVRVGPPLVVDACQIHLQQQHQQHGLLE